MSDFHRLSKRTGDRIFLAKRVQVKADRKKGIPASSEWRYQQVYGHIQEASRDETFYNSATQKSESYTATAWIYPNNFPAQMTSDIFLWANGYFFQILKVTVPMQYGKQLLYQLRLRETQESSRMNNPAL